MRANSEQLEIILELEKDWIHTQTYAWDEHINVYWFGRMDRSDNMVPTKIQAASLTEAWLKLHEHLKAS